MPATMDDPGTSTAITNVETGTEMTVAANRQRPVSCSAQAAMAASTSATSAMAASLAWAAAETHSIPITTKAGRRG
jgi:hypothetical protein